VPPVSPEAFFLCARQGTDIVFLQSLIRVDYEKMPPVNFYRFTTDRQPVLAGFRTAVRLYNYQA